MEMEYEFKFSDNGAISGVEQATIYKFDEKHKFIDRITILLHRNKKAVRFSKINAKGELSPVEFNNIEDIKQIESFFKELSTERNNKKTHNIKKIKIISMAMRQLTQMKNTIRDMFHNIKQSNYLHINKTRLSNIKKQQKQKSSLILSSIPIGSKNFMLTSNNNTEITMVRNNNVKQKSMIQVNENPIEEIYKLSRLYVEKIISTIYTQQNNDLEVGEINDNDKADIRNIALLRASYVVAKSHNNWSTVSNVLDNLYKDEKLNKNGKLISWFDTIGWRQRKLNIINNKFTKVKNRIVNTSGLDVNKDGGIIHKKEAIELALNDIIKQENKKKNLSNVDAFVYCFC